MDGLTGVKLGRLYTFPSKIRTCNLQKKNCVLSWEVEKKTIIREENYNFIEYQVTAMTKIKIK